MTPIYKFYIQTEDNGEKTQVYPSYKDDLSVDYEKESGEQFSGSLYPVLCSFLEMITT